MSRPSTVAQRNLTLTEELEKLEQSITLTLQEIDHNFSRAHRIVTTAILPIVDQYAEHSKNVWEGSKFWKQFFEASANVSLSGYEESPAEDETVTEEDTATGTTPSTSTYGSPPQAHDPTLTPQTNSRAFDPGFYSPSPSLVTPRPVSKSSKTPNQRRNEPTTAPYSSPYASLKRDFLPSAQPSPSESELPSTPRVRHLSPTRRDEGQSSPFAPPSTAAHTARRTPANDMLLHRVLDQNWRIQATPHSAARLPYRTTQPTPKPSTAKKPRSAAPKNDDDDLDSSPLAAPELHAEIFDSPARKGRVPGVSVLTPAKSKDTRGERTDRAAERAGGATGSENAWDSDSDGEDGAVASMSPPKTMQFHVPQGRLMRTPAREASKRIVEDLLLSAGGNVSEDVDDDSPSVVKRGGLLEEDTF